MLRTAQPSWSRQIGFVVRHASSSSSPTPPPEPTRRRRSARTEEVDLGNTDLVAPPDPISNIRPIIYASPFSTQHQRRTPNSPYSASEFASFDAGAVGMGSEGGRGVRGARGSARLQELELEWKLRRERVDAVNHRFWSSMNTQFNTHLSTRLSSLAPVPSISTHPSLSPAELEAAIAQAERQREDVKSQFYADWQAAKRAEMARWVKGWWGDVWEGIWVQGKIHWLRFLGR